MAKKDPKVSQLYVGLKLAKALRKELFDFLQYNAVSVVMEDTEFWYSSVSDTVDRIFKSSIRVSNEVMKTQNELPNYISRINCHKMFSICPKMIVQVATQMLFANSSTRDMSCK